jgi:hypothetical protein
MSGTLRTGGVVRKRILLLPILVAALLAIGPSTAHAGSFTLILQDLTPGAPSSILYPNPVTLEDTDGDGFVSYMATVGNFTVTAWGTILPASPSPTESYTMDLFNFLVERVGYSGTRFMATLVREDLPVPTLGGVYGNVEYAANIPQGGHVNFTTTVAGVDVLSTSEGQTLTPVSKSQPFGPFALAGSYYDVTSVLDFNFGLLDTRQSMDAQAILNVTPTGVPEPTTLLLFGPGVLGLVAFGRRGRARGL